MHTIVRQESGIMLDGKRIRFIMYRIYAKRSQLDNRIELFHCVSYECSWITNISLPQSISYDF